MTKTTRILAAAMLWALGAWAGRCDESMNSLAARLPATANALVLIDVEQTLGSGLAKAQGWGRKLEQAYVARPVFLPPEAKKLALGAALLPQEDFRCLWEVALMELSEPAGVRSIARSEAGFVDEINGRPAAITPVNAAFVDLGDKVLGTVRPADRQFVSRWTSLVDAQRSGQLSDYLRQSLPLVTDRVQVLLAVDLKDVLSRHEIETKLAEASWPGANEIDADAAATVLASLRGATLRVAIDERAQGQLQIDFDEDVGPLAKAVKPLLFHVLDNLGFHSAELTDWEMTASGHSVRMRGDLSDDGLRRVFSVIEFPSVDLGGEESAAASEDAASESQVLDSSLTYFKATQVLVKDLRKGMRDTKATSAWMERYAQKLDELPTLHVDEMLLDYGDKLAETLRIMAVSKRQAGIRSGVRGADGGGYYNGYDYNDAYSSAANRAQARKEEMAVAADTRVEGWRLIDNATADIRRTMTKKYGAEF